MELESTQEENTEVIVDEIAFQDEETNEETKTSLSDTLESKREDHTPLALEIQRRFSIHFKKDRDEDAKLLTSKLKDISDSPIGDIEFEDVVLYLFQNKLDKNDFEEIRAKAFNRKMDLAKIKYNKENKTHYTLQEFLATAVSEYLH